MSILPAVPAIATIGITLDFIAERLALGDTVVFVEKMTSLQNELETYSTAINTTVDDINDVVAILNTVEIGTAYQIAVEYGYVGTELQWLASLKGAQGIPGPSGNGTGYVGPVWSTLDQTAIDALVPGDYVIPSYGGVVELASNAIRYDWGTVATTEARDAIAMPTYGDYLRVVDDGNQYHYFDGSAWVDTGSTSLPTISAYPAFITDRGPVADTTARDALASPTLGDYAAVTADGGQYHYYDGSAWVDTGSTSVPTTHRYLGVVSDTTERDAISNPKHGDYVAVTADSGEFHYYDKYTSAWVDTGSSVALPTVSVHPSNEQNFGSVATTAERDLKIAPQHGDYVAVTADGGQIHYYDGITEAWIDTGSTTLPIVPPNPNLSPDSPSTSWTPVQSRPSVTTAADLDTLVGGSYPDGVRISDTGQVAYRTDSVDQVYQKLCGTSATAWQGKGWVTDHAASGQAARVQCEVTADTHCRVGFQIGTDVADSMLVEITPTQLQAYDSDVAEGQAITVEVGDVIGLFRYSNGQTFINVNSVDVYEFTASDTSAINLYVYFFGVDDCIEYAQSGVDGNFLDPVVWDGYSDATMTEIGRTDTDVWSLDNPAVTAQTSTANNINGWRIYDRVDGQSPVVGGPPNIYPDGSTVGLVGIVNNDIFTFLVAPGESITVDGTTVSIDGGYTNLEPVHFAKRAGSIVRVGGNG